MIVNTTNDISSAHPTGPDTHQAYRDTMGIGSLYRAVKQLGRGIGHPSPYCVLVKEREELYLHSISVSYGMLQSVLYCTLFIKVNFCVRLSHLTPFCSSQNGLQTSLPVASVSCHNCTDKPVTCHVMVKRNSRYYMLVTFLFRVLSFTVKKWY